MPPAGGGQHAGTLYAEMVLLQDPMLRQLMELGTKAAQQSQQMGQQMGQGVSQGFNQAGGLGFANNFIFAIQDASSAVGQFGFTTAGLRFAVLGAANNLQTMAMSSAMAGMSFKALLASIQPIHIGLAAFSVAISLLPLLFDKTDKAAKRAKDSIKELMDSVANARKSREVADVLGQLGFGKEAGQERGGARAAVIANIGETQRQLIQLEAQEAIAAELASQLAKKSWAKAKVWSDRAIELRIQIEQLTKALADQRAELNRIDETNLEIGRAAAQSVGVAIFGALFGGLSGAPTHRQQMQIDADARREARKQAEAREKAIKDAPGIDLEMRERELNIARLHMEMGGRGGKFEFMSPDQYINQLQGQITTGEERMIKNQELQLQLDKEWFELDKARENKAENQGIINAGR